MACPRYSGDDAHMQGLRPDRLILWLHVRKADQADQVGSSPVYNVPRDTGSAIQTWGDDTSATSYMCY